MNHSCIKFNSPTVPLAIVGAPFMHHKELGREAHKIIDKLVNEVELAKKGKY